MIAPNEDVSKLTETDNGQRPLQTAIGRLFRVSNLCAVVLCVWVVLISGSASADGPRIHVDRSAGDPQFVISEITRAAESPGVQAPDVVELSIRGKGEPQSYRIEKDGSTVRVVGADRAGLIYGGLDVAEAIRLGMLTELKTGDHKPFIAQRGIKFNIPLDLRTPSYADFSDSSQANIPEMWSRDFWREFLDEMARHRYNVLSLWNLNPFPSIVKVPEFPDVALNDVLRGNRELFRASRTGSGSRNFEPAFLQDAEVVRRMTIDEKIAFWNDVLKMADDRGIQVYWFTWNIFVWTEEGKDGITRNKPDGALLRYFRASVRETVKTYPLLAGMGITAGENMTKTGNLSKEDWLWQAYGEGIRDGLKGQPNRSFRFIHRLHQTNPQEVQKYWKDYPGPCEISFKYAQGHMYGVTKPPFINKLLPDLSPALRTWLTLRNDDIFSFRWGDPQFVREFIRGIPGPDKVAGFYMGPDGYCWGREDLSLEPDSPRQLVLRKQWFSFMLWGRLSYDPTLPDEFFARTLAARFPEVPPDKLLAGWIAASRVLPEVTRFFWGPFDFQWFPEACLKHPGNSGFFTVEDFMQGQGMDGSHDMTILHWRARLLAKQPMDGITPLEVAANLRQYAATARQTVQELRPQQGCNKELHQTLGDIEAFACLGNYYADKIDGACELALFDATADVAHQAAAVKHLEAALGHWRDYAAAYTRQYRHPVLFGRVGVVDIPKLAVQVAADIELARNWKPGGDLKKTKTPPRKARGSRSNAGEK